MKTFSFFSFSKVLLGAVLVFTLTGCNFNVGGGDSNTTQQQETNETTKPDDKPDSNQTSDTNSTNPLSEAVLKSVVGDFKNISRNINDGSNPYYEMRYTLPEWLIDLMVQDPSTTYWVVDNLGDSILTLFNIKHYKRLSAQIELARLAYKIVQTKEFEDLALEYKGLNDVKPEWRDHNVMNEVGKKMGKVFISKGYPADKYGRVNDELLMSYFRMFSTGYGSEKKGVDSEIWQLILERANEIIEDRLANQEKTPVVEISILKTPPMNIVAGKKQKVTTIEVDTVDSSEGVVIKKIFLNSWSTNDELENCHLRNEDGNKVTDSDDWDSLRENGIEFQKKQGADKVKRYDLYCDVPESLNRRHIGFYRGNFEAEFDAGSAVRDYVFGYSYVYVVEVEEDEGGAEEEGEK